MVKQIDKTGVVTLVDRILTRAHRERASDIHLEPRAHALRVRYRIDGLLVDRPDVPASHGAPVLSRLKIMATLDIAEKRIPQDGAFARMIDDREVSFRLSTFPTEFGEKLVLRILSRTAEALDLSLIGLDEASVDRLRVLVAQPHGMLLVTGPTGSGKTSTLYSLLRELDARILNIVTLEDPIEYRFQDIIQGQTNAKVGFNFARGLRAILRQDPDVVMVGEMRDAETADTAFKAALTGHLVFSSLHTNSAIETFVRLMDMGLERFVVASALEAVIGQRLVRCLCASCREAYAPSPREATLLGLRPDEGPIYRERGCAACAGTGFRGRTGIFEVVEVDEDLADLLKQESASRRALREHMEYRGVLTLQQVGLAKARIGLTTINEVLRVA